MARITAQDCTEVINNCFELVLLASHRAKDLSKGVKPTVEKDNDKNAVISLREIAAKSINIENLRTSYIKSLQKHSNPDIIEEGIEEESEEANMFAESSIGAVDNDAVNVDNYIFEDEVEEELDPKENEEGN